MTAALAHAHSEFKNEITSAPTNVINLMPAISELDILLEMEATLAQETMMDMQMLRDMHPQWLEQFEDADTTQATGRQLAELLVTAPNSFAKGLVGGMLHLRLDVARTTGRHF